MNNQIKWRGIPTTQKKKNEREPKTIINRFGQKSFSLPRIDDKKRWAGFPGNTGISRKIAKIIPLDIAFYVEPFAGTAKVYQALIILASKERKLRSYTAILNDKSKFIYKWLNRELTNDIIITNEDFVKCIKKYDSKKTFFLIDPPWFLTYYKQSFSCFDRKSVKVYDIEVIKLCKKLKGKFIITTRKENKIMLNSGFYNYLIKSEYPVSGKLPKVLLTTNMKLKGLEEIKKAPVRCTYCNGTNTINCNCGKAYCRIHDIDHLAECFLPVKDRHINK